MLGGMKMHKWHARAKCVTTGAPTRLFFEDIFGERGEIKVQDGRGRPAAGAEMTHRPIDLVRDSHCALCPTRRECLAASLDEESGKPISQRHGLFAGLTPAQRHSVEQRGGAACPQCGCTLDPLGFAEGVLACDNCAYEATVPAIPEDGDGWLPRHNALAEVVVSWLIENSRVGDKVPTPTGLAKTISARKHDVIRVYEALLYDSTLRRDEKGAYYRLGRTGAMRSWSPPHLAA